MFYYIKNEKNYELVIKILKQQHNSKTSGLPFTY